MASNYFIEVLLPVLTFAIVCFSVFNFFAYRSHKTDVFLGVITRPLTETKDFKAIHGRLLQKLEDRRATHLLTTHAKERIHGAAEKAVPQIRVHGNIQVQLPALYEHNGQYHDLVLTLTLKDIRS